MVRYRFFSLFTILLLCLDVAAAQASSVYWSPPGNYQYSWRDSSSYGSDIMADYQYETAINSYISHLYTLSPSMYGPNAHLFIDPVQFYGDISSAIMYAQNQLSDYRVRRSFERLYQANAELAAAQQRLAYAQLASYVREAQSSEIET